MAVALPRLLLRSWKPRHVVIVNRLKLLIAVPHSVQLPKSFSADYVHYCPTNCVLEFDCDKLALLTLCLSSGYR